MSREFYVFEYVECPTCHGKLPYPIGAYLLESCATCKDLGRIQRKVNLKEALKEIRAIDGEEGKG